MVSCTDPHRLGIDICDSSQVKKLPPNGMRPFGVKPNSKTITKRRHESLCTELKTPTLPPPTELP